MTRRTTCGTVVTSSSCAASLDESRQRTARGGFNVRSEAGWVLLHQAVERSLRWAVALVVDLGAIRRPLGLPTDGLRDGLQRE